MSETKRNILAGLIVAAFLILISIFVSKYFINNNPTVDEPEESQAVVESTTPTPTSIPSTAPTAESTALPEPVIETGALFTKENYPIVDASLAIHPLVNAIAADFLDVDSSTLEYKYTGGRSSDVYKGLIDGETDVIFAAEISPMDIEYAEEMGVELEILPATRSAFVFIVNSENPVDGLTLQQIRDIYSGKITNWSEVGGDDAEIIAYQRPNGSGSQTAMMSLVMNKESITMAPTIKVEMEMGGLIDAVAEYDNSRDAIGYSYFYYVNSMYKKDTIKMLKIDGVEPSVKNIKSGSYPIATGGYIVYRKDDTRENVHDWVEAVLSPRGSRIIEGEGYVPLA